MIVYLDFSNLTQDTQILIEDKLEAIVKDLVDYDIEQGLILNEDRKIEIFSRVNELRKRCKIYLELDENQTVDNSI